MANPYEYLSEVYEKLNDDCGYPQWILYVKRILGEYSIAGYGLELGCGTGVFLRALSKAGFVMDGADVSAQMLTKAEYYAREEGIRANFYCMDAVSLRTPVKYDFVISINDCFNYISPSHLERAFSSVKRALKAGGLFLFDVSSPYKLRGKVANNISVDDRDDVTYLSVNSLVGDGVDMDVTLFLKRKDGAFDRFDEHHHEYIHEEAEIVSVLQSVGFDVLRVEGHLGENKSQSDRLNFICRKR